MQNDPGTGLHEIPEALYHASPRLSRSQLWHMRHSPAHCQAYRVTPPESSAFDMGSAIHTAALEPHLLDDNYSCRPEGINARTTAGKAELAAWRDDNRGKILLDKPDALKTLRGVATSVLAHPVASQLLTGEGKTELSAYWTDEQTGVDCRARFDRLVPYSGGFAGCDLKSIGKPATTRNIEYAVRDHGLHFQAGMYLEGLDAIIGPALRAWLLIFVEKAPPYAVRIVELDQAYIDAGRLLFGRYIDRYAKCAKSGVWPGYPTDVGILEKPEWL